MRRVPIRHRGARGGPILAQRPLRRSWSWTIGATALAAAFFAVALSGAVYETTSPPWLSFHVLLRKLYSVVAFAIVGYAFRRALEERGTAAPRSTSCIVGVATYSAAIEIAQWLLGSHEGLGWNIFDVACGALGGAIAVADVLLRRRSIRGSRTH